MHQALEMSNVEGVDLSEATLGDIVGMRSCIYLQCICALERAELAPFSVNPLSHHRHHVIHNVAALRLEVTPR